MYALKKLVLELLLTAFLKKRMASLIKTEKRHQVLKGKADICFFFQLFQLLDYFFCFRLLREVSVCQRLRGKED